MSGWIKIVPKPAPPHECRVPNLDDIDRMDAGVGSKWECRDCELVWILMEGPSWAPVRPPVDIADNVRAGSCPCEGGWKE